MTPGGPLGGGSADKAKQPQKPPDKSSASSEARKQPPPADTQQQNGKGSKDNQGTAGPQGGKPGDVTPRQPGDVASRQPGGSGSGQPADTAGRQTGDAGSRRGGDAPAKAEGGRPGDVRQQAGDQHPGWRQSANFGEWRAQSQALWQPRPDSRTPAGPTDAKGTQHSDQRYEKFSHRINLEDCRADNGKLDRGRLKAKLEGFVRADQLERTNARVHAANDRHYQGPVVSNRPMEVTVRFEHARSYVDVREVASAMREVSDKYRVHCRAEIPGRPPVDFRPGPVIPSDRKPGAGQGRLGTDPPRVHDPQEGVQLRRVPQVPPGGWRNTPRGR